MLNVEDLKHFLMKFLPNYAIPTYFIKLDKLPINTNGKVDSKLLPSPQLVNTKSQIIPARNIVDQKIIFVLKEILNINKISIDDSFFDLGGDSLTAITLCSKIYNEFNIQLSIKDILENPIIKDLSDVISSKDLHNKNCPLKKAEIKDIYQASFAQKESFTQHKLSLVETMLYIMSQVDY